MTRDEIIEMAQEAKIVVTGDAVWKLCELVTAAERERCAKECILMADDFELEVNQRGLVEKMKQHFGVK